MSTWAIVGIIVLVLGIIVSNIMLIKRSANTKFGSKITEANKKPTETEKLDKPE
ncbi:DUF2897 family protein [Aestuariibacter sp. AA17]|uniref:DUF2897 family protein n=1 Tax=Fluctibacter corallii TaxID=2984329 RepID=A0ABT3A501_9ALTE|nr:DUF2897 family protein [Aestuariibacter sp. AA17]MCV2883773.1 DUF2897 family protein [Aestuariibacter sp. AA17]